VCGGSYMAPMVAITQRVMPVHMRAVSTALLYLLLNLIGPGLGPVVAGIFNDVFAASYGPEAVRLSLTLTLVGAIFAVALTLYAAKHLPEDLASMDRASRAPPTAAQAPVTLL